MHCQQRIAAVNALLVLEQVITIVSCNTVTMFVFGNNRLAYCVSVLVVCWLKRYETARGSVFECAI